MRTLCVVSGTLCVVSGTLCVVTGTLCVVTGCQSPSCPWQLWTGSWECADDPAEGEGLTKLCRIQSDIEVG